MRGAERLTAPRPVPVLDAAASVALDAATIAAGTASYELMRRAGERAAARIVALAARGFGSGDEPRVASGAGAGAPPPPGAVGATFACCLAGAGNNGGDAYVVADALAEAGWGVFVLATGAPATADATRARAALEAAHPDVAVVDLEGPWYPAQLELSQRPGVVVDGLLGTGARGALRGVVHDLARTAARLRDDGAWTVALDVPTGVDATTGEVAEDAIVADVTLAFGGVKLGLTGARAHAGRIEALDLGFVAPPAGTPRLADAAVLRDALPPIAWNAHKGRRGHVRITGGTAGMAGAAQLAARGALRGGAGLVRAAVHSASAHALQAALPAVIVEPWRARTHVAFDAALDESLGESLGELVAERPPVRDAVPADWAHAHLVGPGLGRDAAARRRLQEALVGSASRTVPPVLLLDADALTLVAGDRTLLQALVAHAARAPVVLTPHPGEFARLVRAVAARQQAAGAERDGADDAAHAAVHDAARDATHATSHVAAHEGAYVAEPAAAHDPDARTRATRALADALGVVVVHKGTPTIVAAPHDAPWIVPRGSAVLGSGGSGDVLGGLLAAALAGAVVRARTTGAALALPEVARVAAAVAWVHGVAGEVAGGTDGRPVRGRALDDVLAALPRAFDALQTSGEDAALTSPAAATAPAVPAAHVLAVLPALCDA